MATRQTKRQLHFSGFEMTMIAVGYLVTVTAVFLLGLAVGKKNASYHAPAEDRVARVPVDDFTKYKRPEPLAAKGGGGKAPASPEAQAPAADAKPAAKPAEPQVVATKAPAEASKAAADPKEAANKAAADAKAKAEKDAAAKEAAAKKKAAEQAEPATGRGYTVQILATRKQPDAEALVRKLKSRGYAAYVKKISDGAGAWYRVRVGSYGAFSEARTMADKCRHDLGLGQAFVSTE